jgi:hypothetical protein
VRVRTDQQHLVRKAVVLQRSGERGEIRIGVAAGNEYGPAVVDGSSSRFCVERRDSRRSVSSVQ